LFTYLIRDGICGRVNQSEFIIFVGCICNNRYVLFTNIAKFVRQEICLELRKPQLSVFMSHSVCKNQFFCYHFIHKEFFLLFIGVRLQLVQLIGSRLYERYLKNIHKIGILRENNRSTLWRVLRKEKWEI